MPLRIRCRCGQELVLRFSEWVHALIGLLVLCLLVNGTALVFIAWKMGELKTRIEERGKAPPADPEISAARRGKEGILEEVKEPLEGVSGAAGGEGSKTPPAPAMDGGRAPGDGFPVGSRDPSTPEPGPAALPKIPEKASTEPGEGERREGSEKAEVKMEANAIPGPGIKPLLDGASPLERLLALERCSDQLLILAFLEDSDSLVKLRALRKALAMPLPAGPAPFREHLALVLPMAPWIIQEEGGADLLRRLSGEDHGPDGDSWWRWARGAFRLEPSKGPPTDSWEPLAARGPALLESSSALRALGKFFQRGDGEGGRGTDVLVAIDTTESMEEPLAALSKCGWIFPVLAWAIRDLRAGILCYKDEVTGTLGLGTDPQELSRSLKELKAEEGGDVPEGVHDALRVALQLGRFQWRPESVKHIIFVGDGPPPRTEVPQLISLARECHREGGFQIHAISVNPTEGRQATLYFQDLAKAGGGRAVTAPGSRIAAEIFLIPFPEEAREDLGGALPIIAQLVELKVDAMRGKASASTDAPWK